MPGSWGVGNPAESVGGRLRGQDWAILYPSFCLSVSSARAAEAAAEAAAGGHRADPAWSAADPEADCLTYRKPKLIIARTSHKTPN